MSAEEMKEEMNDETGKDAAQDTAGIDKLLDQLRQKRAEVRLGGGKERIEAQHKKGKQTARERIAQFLDNGTFQEIDPLRMHRHSDFGMAEQKYLGDGMVAGFGKVNGRPVAVFSQDFTILGGSFSEVHAQKLAKIMDIALESGFPVIGLNDSGGARIQEGEFSLAAFGELFWRNSRSSGVIPQISVQLGPCAGGAVYSPALTDFIIMTKQISHMFITGPEVIKAVTGEEVDFETLGGAMAHNSLSGVAHFAAEDESDAFAITRRLLSYLPSNNMEKAPAVEPTDNPWRMEKRLDYVVPADPNVPYDMRDAVNLIFDEGSFMEVHASFAMNSLVGFARLHGQSVGIVGQQPMNMAGVIDIDAADKMARFIRFCDAFNIPLFTFVDSPGFLPGTAQEHGGIIRHGAKIVYAYSEATVPKICIITRKGYGGAEVVMSSKAIRSDFVFAWPTAEIAVMGADGAVNILHRKAIKDHPDPAAERERLIQEYREAFSTPYRAAASGHIDDVLLPSESRPKLIAALEILKNKHATLPPKKHGNMPL